MSILLTTDEINKLCLDNRLNLVPVEIIAHNAAKAQLKKIAKRLLELPTDGWDKWHFYHKDLAEILLKELRE